jgi:hypothetical protein
MILVRAVADTTMLVRGYEHQDWQCSVCSEVEHRFVFTREKTEPQAAHLKLKANIPTSKQTDVAEASTQTGDLPPGEVLVLPTQPEPPDTNDPTQTDVEARGAITSTSKQDSAVRSLSAAVQRVGIEPVKTDIAASTQTHPEEHGATPSNSEQAIRPVQPTPNSAAVEFQQAIVPAERRVPASAWARAVTKLRNWQTEKGSRQNKPNT